MSVHLNTERADFFNISLNCMKVVPFAKIDWFYSCCPSLIFTLRVSLAISFLTNRKFTHANFFKCFDFNVSELCCHIGKNVERELSFF